MATTRTATGVWHGSLLEGNGQVTLESSGTGRFDVTWAARAEEPEGHTSPEELIAAAHAACFSMALSGGLAKAGHPPTTLNTRAEVDFQPGEGITGVRLWVSGDVPGLDADGFREAAESAKDGCPVSQALSVPISLTVE
ncbi:MAG TPA: OsmC family peroxiredoxin [Actinomycetota bacterium]|nr:OsmC family peroxiredoxin [Actinomycetota bacterium]